MHSRAIPTVRSQAHEYYLKPRSMSASTSTGYQQQIQTNIETLKADLPTLFEKDISYDIYTQNIFFQDPVNTFKWKFNYRIIFWTLRFHGKLFFTDLHFDLHDVHYEASEDVIKAYWTVRGTLRLPWKAKVSFNGDSTYKLTPEGLIDEHRDTWDRPPKEILKQFLPNRS
jgi:hypothetical protein